MIQKIKNTLDKMPIKEASSVIVKAVCDGTMPIGMYLDLSTHIHKRKDRP